MNATEKSQLIKIFACDYENIPHDQDEKLFPVHQEIPTGETVAFFQVGRNASHEFYLGMSQDGTMWKYSVGEGMYVTDENGEIDYTQPPPLDKYFRTVDPSGEYGVGYIGHY